MGASPAEKAQQRRSPRRVRGDTRRHKPHPRTKAPVPQTSPLPPRLIPGFPVGFCASRSPCATSVPAPFSASVTGYAAANRDAVSARFPCICGIVCPVSRAISPGCGVRIQFVPVRLLNSMQETAQFRPSASKTTGHAAFSSTQRTSCLVSSVTPKPQPSSTPLARRRCVSSCSRLRRLLVRKPFSSVSSESHIASGAAAAKRMGFSGAVATVTRPAPPRSAAWVESKQAPGIFRLPVMHRSRPKSPFWASVFRLGIIRQISCQVSWCSIMECSFHNVSRYDIVSVGLTKRFLCVMIGCRLLPSGRRCLTLYYLISLLVSVTVEINSYNLYKWVNR